VDFTEERNEVAYFLRRIYAQHLTTCSGGNVSRRIDSDLVAITAGSTDKARMRPQQVALYEMSGKTLTPDLSPSKETTMHLRIYQRCPEVGAVIHAHPPHATVFCCVDTPINIELLAETYALVDPPVVAPFALSGSDELAEVVSECATRSSSILMRSHGVTTTGKDLLQAFNRLELLEAAAFTTLTAQQLEGAQALTSQQKNALDRLVGRPV
jgi:L-fuculose-phosphate aldolase